MSWKPMPYGSTCECSLLPRDERLLSFQPAQPACPRDRPDTRMKMPKAESNRDLGDCIATSPMRPTYSFESCYEFMQIGMAYHDEQ